MLIYLAFVLIFLHATVVFILIRGQRQIASLPAQAIEHTGSWPRVSIVIAARNEEADIEHALKSVLCLDYPDYEVIAVNDRSTDNTGSVLDRLSKDEPRLRVVTVESLPPGWLGKNHALHQGAALASGELLLFTDADVAFSRDCLRKAVQVFEDDKLDHLAVLPTLRSPSLWVGILVAVFIRNFTLFVRPWKAKDPKSPSFIGVGAFNLVRRAAYQQVQGHEAIRLRPDDDMKLGKLLKNAGFKQNVRNALDDLSVPWYASLGAMSRGLEKNVLAGVDYRVSFLLLSLVVLVAVEVLPWMVVALGDPVAALLGSVAGLFSLAGFGLYFPQSKTSYWWLPLLPAAALLLVYIFGRSALLTFLRGGIVWRGTFYPLRELRQNAV